MKSSDVFLQYLRLAVLSMAVTAAFGVRSAACAQEWPRYYIGAGVGKSTIGPDWDSVGVPAKITPGAPSGSGTGGKLVAGFRPARVVGVEIELVDFGDAHVHDHNSPNGSLRSANYSLKSDAKATVLSAALFVPDPWPTIDVYGKVGLAKLDESFEVNIGDFSPACRAQDLAIATVCIYSAQGGQKDSRAYLAAGARFTVAPSVAVRVEYETVDRDVGRYTSLWSVGVAFER